MATCPECDADVEVDEFDVDKGDLISCPECGTNLEVTSTSPVELDRGYADHLEAGAAFGATQLVALVDVELVDFDLGIAFRAGGHTVSDQLRILCQRDEREYNEPLRRSAISRNAAAGVLR